MLPKLAQPTYGWPLYGWPLWPVPCPCPALLQFRTSVSEVLSGDCSLREPMSMQISTQVMIGETNVLF